MHGLFRAFALSICMNSMHCSNYSQQCSFFVQPLWQTGSEIDRMHMQIAQEMADVRQ